MRTTTIASGLGSASARITLIHTRHAVSIPPSPCPQAKCPCAPKVMLPKTPFAGICASTSRRSPEAIISPECQGNTKSKHQGLGQRRQRGAHRACAGGSPVRLPTGEHLPAIPGRSGPSPRRPRRAAAAPSQALLLRHSKIAAVVRGEWSPQPRVTQSHSIFNSNKQYIAG